MRFVFRSSEDPAHEAGVEVEVENDRLERELGLLEALASAALDDDTSAVVVDLGAMGLGAWCDPTLLASAVRFAYYIAGGDDPVAVAEELVRHRADTPWIDVVSWLGTPAALAQLRAFRAAAPDSDAGAAAGGGGGGAGGAGPDEETAGHWAGRGLRARAAREGYSPAVGLRAGRNAGAFVAGLGPENVHAEALGPRVLAQSHLRELVQADAGAAALRLILGALGNVEAKALLRDFFNDRKTAVSGKVTLPLVDLWLEAFPVDRDVPSSEDFLNMLRQGVLSVAAMRGDAPLVFRLLDVVTHMKDRAAMDVRARAEQFVHEAAKVLVNHGFAELAIAVIERYRPMFKPNVLFGLALKEVERPQMDGETLAWEAEHGRPHHSRVADHDRLMVPDSDEDPEGPSTRVTRWVLDHAPEAIEVEGRLDELFRSSHNLPSLRFLWNLAQLRRGDDRLAIKPMGEFSSEVAWINADRLRTLQWLFDQHIPGLAFAGMSNMAFRTAAEMEHMETLRWLMKLRREHGVPIDPADLRNDAARHALHNGTCPSPVLRYLDELRRAGVAGIDLDPDHNAFEYLVRRDCLVDLVWLWETGQADITAGDYSAVRAMLELERGAMLDWFLERQILPIYGLLSLARSENGLRTLLTALSRRNDLGEEFRFPSLLLRALRREPDFLVATRDVPRSAILSVALEVAQAVLAEAARAGGEPPFDLRALLRQNYFQPLVNAAIHNDVEALGRMIELVGDEVPLAEARRALSAAANNRSTYAIGRIRARWPEVHDDIALAYARANGHHDVVAALTRPQ